MVRELPVCCDHRRATEADFLCPECVYPSSQKSASLPLVRAPPDALRFGFYSASEDVRPLHEVQRLQTTVRGVRILHLDNKWLLY